MGLPGNILSTSLLVISETQISRSALASPCFSRLRSRRRNNPGLWSPTGTLTSPALIRRGSRWNMSWTVTATGTSHCSGTRWACSWSVMCRRSASEPAIDDETNAGCLRHLVSRRLGAKLRIWCSRVLTLDHPGTMARWSSDSTAWWARPRPVLDGRAAPLASTTRLTMRPPRRIGLKRGRVMGRI